MEEVRRRRGQGWRGGGRVKEGRKGGAGKSSRNRGGWNVAMLWLALSFGLQSNSEVRQ